MKKTQLNHILVVVLIFAGSLFAGATAVNAANASGTNSEVTAEFYGKKDAPINGGNNTGNSGVSNKRLPQTGDFVMPNISLYGYVLVTVGVSWLLLNNRKKKVN